MPRQTIARVTGEQLLCSWISALVPLSTKRAARSGDEQLDIQSPISVHRPPRDAYAVDRRCYRPDDDARTAGNASARTEYCQEPAALDGYRGPGHEARRKNVVCFTPDVTRLRALKTTVAGGDVHDRT
jgi:hypothetical protein